MIQETENRKQNRFLRWIIYLLIIGAASASGTIRILNVNLWDAATRKVEQSDGSPLLCANDRSRWCTIRSLGDDGKYEIDEVIADPRSGEFSFSKRLRNPFWVTIDLVKHADPSGEMHYYSSKPPLLPTLLAYLYRFVNLITGWDLENNTFEVVQTMLIIVNVVPTALFLILLACTLELLTDDTFTKIILVLAASFGTFLTPFIVTLNNHLPAAISAGISLYSTIWIYKRGGIAPFHFFLAGLFSAFTAANELPALSFLCFTGFILLIRGPMQTIACFIPGVAIVVSAFFGTNYQAHHDWIPPYAHRKDGAKITTLDKEQWEDVTRGVVSADLANDLNRYSDLIGFNISETTASVNEGQMPLDKGVEVRYVLTQSDDSQRLAIVKTEEQEYEVRAWNNWYDYPESRWLLPNKEGVDQGEPDAQVYAFHCLIGHHGIFSLTPMWLLTLCGMPMWFTRGRRKYGWIALMTIVVSVVVIAFYLARPMEDRNYGGGTSALRWLLWLAPLWIVAAVPFVELLSRSIWGKISVTLLVVLSAVSAHYSAMNPWVHPWLYELLVELNWIDPF